jgi:hypothetical protein
VAPELVLALIQIVLGLALGLAWGYLARARTEESGVGKVAVIAKTVIALGLAATLVGVVGVVGATEIISRLAVAWTQTVIALAAAATAVCFCLRHGADADQLTRLWQGEGRVAARRPALRAFGARGARRGASTDYRGLPSEMLEEFAGGRLRPLRRSCWFHRGATRVRCCHYEGDGGVSTDQCIPALNLESVQVMR